MTENAPVPRKIWLMAIIAVVLGAPALMLWLGRGRSSLGYFVAAALAAVSGIALIACGVLPMHPFASTGPAALVWVTRIPIDIAGFLHGLAINKSTPLRPWFSRWYVALPSYAVASLALAFVVRTFLYQPFDMPSGSGIPNLMIGDMFFASKTAYRSGDPERGDLAVFKLPRDGKTDYVKRVIGLPGDVVQMKSGRLYLNGAAVERALVTLGPEFSPEPHHLIFYRETLPSGRTYTIGELSDFQQFDDTTEYKVPAGHYFMMGDNRDNSVDSRLQNEVGFVPRQNIYARFAVRFWNTTGFPLTGRPEETR